MIHTRPPTSHFLASIDNTLLFEVETNEIDGIDDDISSQLSTDDSDSDTDSSYDSYDNDYRNFKGSN